MQLQTINSLVLDLQIIILSQVTPHQELRIIAEVKANTPDISNTVIPITKSVLSLKNTSKY